MQYLQINSKETDRRQPSLVEWVPVSVHIRGAEIKPFLISHPVFRLCRCKSYTNIRVIQTETPVL